MFHIFFAFCWVIRGIVYGQAGFFLTIADKFRDEALIDSVVLSNITTIQIWGTIQEVLLLMVIVISVQKPWKKNIGKIY